MKKRASGMLAMMLSLLLLFTLVACSQQEAANGEIVENEIVTDDPNETMPKGNEDVGEQTQTNTEGEASKEVEAEQGTKTPGAAESSSQNVPSDVAGEQASETPSEKPAETPAETPVEVPAEKQETEADDSVEVSKDVDLLKALLDEQVSNITVTQTIKLSEPVVVSGNKTITGAKIVAAKAMDAMYVVNEGASLTIKESIIDGASLAGSVVRSKGTVQLANVEIKGTTASALYNESAMALKYVKISNCTTADRGAGVFNNGALTVESCSFSNNTAKKDGGAIYGGINSKLELTGSHFEKNSAANGGSVKMDALRFDVSVSKIADCVFVGGSASTYGGEIDSMGELVVSNCSFNGGYAKSGGGAMVSREGKTMIENCSFTNCISGTSGGAIRSSAVTTTKNCTFINNTAKNGGGGGVYYTSYATGHVDGCTFQNNAAIGGGGGGIYTYGTQTNAAGVEIVGSTFSNNTATGYGGGIYNMGMMRLADTKLDKCTSGTQGGAFTSAMGIIELENCEISNCSAATNGGAVRSSSTIKAVNCTFTKNSSGGKSSGGTIYCTAAADAWFTDCTFRENVSDNDGGVFYLYGTETVKCTGEVRNCKFIDNVAADCGGVIRNQADMDFVDCYFSGNRCEANGGAAYNNGWGLLDFIGCVFEENEANHRGGAIYNYNVNPEEGNTENETITQNTETAARIKVWDCEFTRNTALKGGGAVCTGGMMYFSGSDFTANECLTWHGGAIYALAYGHLEIEDCHFEGNESGSEGVAHPASYNGERDVASGGAIRVNGRLLAKNCDFIGNIADDPDPNDASLARGGAVYVMYSGSAELIGCLFRDNYATHYGGAVTIHGVPVPTMVGYDYIGNAKIENCDFYNNESNDGGAICNYGRTTISGGEIADNVATRNGAGIYVHPSSLVETTLKGNVNIHDNSAGNAGGGVYAGGALEINGATIQNNTASSKGDVYVLGGEHASLTIKGSNNVDTVYLAEGKKITVGAGASANGITIYKEGGVSSGDGILEGSGSGDISVETGDGRYESEIVPVPGTDKTETVLKPKTHSVTIDGTSAADATYGTDYTFTITAGQSVSATVNGKKVSVSVNGTNCTISGEDIIGAVVITTTTLTPPASIPADAQAYILKTDGAAGTLAEVLAAAVDGDTIVLKKDVIVDASLALDKDITVKTDAAVTMTVEPAAQINVTADVLVDGDVTIAGSTRATPAITVSGRDAQLVLGADVTVTGMENASIDALGKMNGLGGAVLAEDGATLSATGTTFQNNSAYKGGAIYASDAVVKLIDVTFVGNSAADASDADNNKYSAGGALCVAAGAEAYIDGVTFKTNKTGGYGGALFADGAFVTVKGSEFTSNQSNRFGGAVSSFTSGSVSFTDTLFKNNTAKAQAGAAYINSATVTFGDGVVMTGNKAGSVENSMFYYSGTLQLSGELDLGIIKMNQKAIALAGEVTAPAGKVAAKLEEISGFIGPKIVLVGDEEVVWTEGMTSADYDSVLVYDYKALLTNASYVANSYKKFELVDASYTVDRNGKLALLTGAAAVDGVGYDTLEEAVAAANGMGGTDPVIVSILGDITVESATTIPVNANVYFHVTKDVSITGDVTFDGQGANRTKALFEVDADGVLRLNGVTVQNFVNTTNLRSAVITILPDKKGEVVLDGVTFKANTAPRGAVYVPGSAKLTVKDSTFDSNTATESGGAIFVYATGNVNITGGTFTKNTAPNAAAIHLESSTSVATINGASFPDNVVNANGADISSNGKLTLGGAMTLDSIKLSAGRKITIGENLTFAAKPKLNSLGFDTQVLDGNFSDYTDAFELHCANCDIDANGVLTCNTIASVTVDGNTTVHATLEDAFATAAAANTAATVYILKDVTYTEPATLALGKNVKVMISGNVTLSGPLTINGGGASNTHTDHPFVVAGGSTLTLENGVKIENIYSSVTNNGVFRVEVAESNPGKLVMDGITVTGCSGPRGVVYGQGGAIFELKNSTFTNNTSTTHGGVVFVYGAATATVENCTFIGNSATKAGGVFYFGSASKATTITGCTFINNKAGANAGAICMDGSAKATVTVKDSTFGNDETFSGDNGGGNGSVFFMNGGTATFDNCTIEDSVGKAYGTIRAGGGNLTLKNGTKIINNKTANKTGIGLDIRAGNVVLDGVTISGNVKKTADATSSDLYFAGTGTLTVKGENTIDRIALASGKTLTLEGTVTGDIRIMGVAAGTTVLSGSATDIAASCEAFSILNASGAATELVVGTNGKVAAAASLSALEEVPVVEESLPVEESVKTTVSVIESTVAPAEPPIETPTETPTETPVEIPAETPVETPVETPAETPVETPVEIPVEALTEIPTEVVVEVPEEISIEILIDAPAEVTSA